MRTLFIPLPLLMLGCTTPAVVHIPATTPATSTHNPTGGVPGTGTETGTHTTTGTTTPTGTWTSTGVPQASIPDIQQGVHGVGTELEVTGVVTAVGASSVWIQDAMGGPWSGLRIDLGLGFDTTYGPLEIGDALTLVGLYQELDLVSVLDLTGAPAPALTVASTGQPVLSEALTVADLVDPDTAEQWEGVLVTVASPLVKDAAPSADQFIATGSTWTWDLEVSADLFALPEAGDGTLPHGGSFTSLTGVMTGQDDVRMLAPRMDTDCEGVPAPAPPPPGGTNGTNMDIYDLQAGALASGTLTDVFMVCAMAMADDGFYMMQDRGGEGSGIFVYTGDRGGMGLMVGDVIDVTGVYREFHGESQVDLSQTGSVDAGSNVSPPNPAALSVADLADPMLAEPWEGVLVAVTGITVEDPLSGTGEFTVTDGNGNSVAIDNHMHLYSDYDTLAAGDSFVAIMGMLREQGGVYRIEPRSDSDLMP